MRTAAEDTEPRARSAEPRAGRRLGALAGLAAISCCVYPVVLFLFGLSSAVAAIDLGTTLYGEWGWAFKLAGAGFAVAGIVVHLLRRGQCSIAGAQRSWPFIARVLAVALVTYWGLYGITRGLAALGS